LKPLFGLFNTNNFVFNYINKLPAPNSFKYSFIDYCIKIFLSLEREIEEDELKKELNNLLNEICFKNKKDLNFINNSDLIDLYNCLHFNEFLFHSIKNLSIPEKVRFYEGKLYYISGKNLPKTTLTCFSNPHYFTNLEEKNINDDLTNKDGTEIHMMLCFVIYSEKDQNIYIDFKPYFNSTLEIKAKKENHYFLFCNDIEDNIILNDDEIDKLIDYTNLNIKTEETKVEALPQANNNQVSNDECAINCPVCGSVNVLNEGNPEYKCVFCESPLF
jgi:hypothetical protein